jgi:hypothetical protein
MDVHYLDFDSVIRLCQSRQLYSALTYVYNRGLMDYKTPVDVLLSGMHGDDSASTPNADGSKAADATGSTGSVAADISLPADVTADWSQRQQLGYRLLLYVSYCFTGKNFPSGTPFHDPDLLPEMRKEVLEVLIEQAPTRWVDRTQRTY